MVYLEQRALEESAHGEFFAAQLTWLDRDAAREEHSVLVRQEALPRLTERHIESPTQRRLVA